MAIETSFDRHGHRRYRVRVKDRVGRQMPSKTFETKNDAERYERQIKSSVDSGLNAQIGGAQKISFRAYWDIWISECRSAVSEGWKYDQIRMGNDYILPFLAPLKLNEIQPSDISRVIENARQLGKAPQTIGHVFNTMHKAFEDAIHHYVWLDKNPVRRRYKPVVPKRDRAFLTPDESMTLLDHSRNHRIGPAIWLALLSGLRPSEVMALRYVAVDFTNSEISIRAAYKRKMKRIEDFPKQKNWGRAAMPPGLVAYLQERSAHKGSSDFVAADLDGEMLSYHVFYKLLRSMCRDLKLTVVTPHELRHSCTELWVEQGATLEDLRRQLNHASVSATKTYMHRSDRRLKEIAAEIQVPVQKPHSPRRHLTLVV